MSDNDFEYMGDLNTGDDCGYVITDAELHFPPTPTWEASFFGGDVLVSIVNPPNFFHRWMWSLLLGAKWRKLNV